MDIRVLGVSGRVAHGVPSRQAVGPSIRTRRKGAPRKYRILLAHAVRALLYSTLLCSTLNCPVLPIRALLHMHYHNT